MVAQKVVFIPVIHRGLQEEPTDTQMSHLLKSAVRGVNAAAYDAEAFPSHLLAQQVIFGEEHLFVESAELAEFLQVEQHEHSRREGMMETRQILEEVITCVKQLVDPVAVAAQDVRGHTM